MLAVIRSLQDIEGTDRIRGDGILCAHSCRGLIVHGLESRMAFRLFFCIRILACVVSISHDTAYCSLYDLGRMAFCELHLTWGTRSARITWRLGWKSLLIYRPSVPLGPPPPIHPPQPPSNQPQPAQCKREGAQRESAQRESAQKRERELRPRRWSGRRTSLRCRSPSCATKWSSCPPTKPIRCR